MGIEKKSLLKNENDHRCLVENAVYGIGEKSVVLTIDHNNDNFKKGKSTSSEPDQNVRRFSCAVSHSVKRTVRRTLPNFERI